MIILHTVYNTLFFLLGVVLGVWKKILKKTSDRWIDRLIAILKIGSEEDVVCVCVFVCMIYCICTCPKSNYFEVKRDLDHFRWVRPWNLVQAHDARGEARLIARRCRKLVSSLDVHRDVLITTAPKTGLIDPYTCRNLQSYRYSNSIVGYWV